MAMQIDPTFAHIRQVRKDNAQDEVRAIDTHFSIGLDAFLAIVAIDRSIVIFPCDRAAQRWETAGKDRVATRRYQANT